MSVFILWSCQADPAAVADACPIGPILFSVHVFQKARLFTSRKVLMNLFMLFLLFSSLVIWDSMLRKVLTASTVAAIADWIL